LVGCSGDGKFCQFLWRGLVCVVVRQGDSETSLKVAAEKVLIDKDGSKYKVKTPTFNRVLIVPSSQVPELSEICLSVSLDG
jgi:hypothetical protein